MSQQHKLSRRQFLAMVGVGGTGVLLAACTPQAAPVAQPTQAPAATEAPAATQAPAPTEAPAAVQTPGEATTTVECWWNNWGDLYDGLMEKSGVAYTKENPGVTVKWTFSPDWQQNLLTALAAGTAPDCSYTNFQAQATLAHDGAWAPLDEYFAQAGLGEGTFIKSMWKQSLYNGKAYCVPGGADFIAVYYNKDLYKEVGLDPEKPPTTTQELIDHSMKILKKGPSGAIDRLGYAPVSYEFRAWAFIFGGGWFDEATQKLTADNPGNVAALNWLKAYVADLDPNQLASFTQSLPNFWSPGNSFASMKTAYSFDGYWTYDAMNQFAPKVDYGVAFWPTLKGTPEERSRYVIEGWMVGIPTGAKQAAAAWDFMKYAFVDNAWSMGCETLNGNCVLAEMPQYVKCTEEKLGPNDRMTPYFPVFSQTGAAGTNYWPAIPVNAMYWDEVNRAYDYVIRGEKTAEEALAEVNKTVQPEYDKVMAGG